MDTDRYIPQVLEGHLAPFYHQKEKERPGIVFQQDNAPSHTSKRTKKWLADHDIDLFPHPPNSPDLNPIEPLWHDLKTYTFFPMHSKHCSEAHQGCSRCLGAVTHLRFRQTHKYHAGLCSGHLGCKRRAHTILNAEYVFHCIYLPPVKFWQAMAIWVLRYAQFFFGLASCDA
jgi:transposase InsO family protein